MTWITPKFYVQNKLYNKCKEFLRENNVRNETVTSFVKKKIHLSVEGMNKHLRFLDNGGFAVRFTGRFTLLELVCN